MNLRSLDLAELQAFFVEAGEPSYRSTQVFRRIHRHGARKLDEFTELPAELRRRLEGCLPSAEVEDRAVDAGGTEKVIFRAPDENGSSRFLEAVWIVGDERLTVCLSSQVGCTLDCSFCATGTLPFKGNLASWQIVDQVYALERLRGRRATNVVFMGMGEPFHNYDQVIAAAHLLCHPEGAALGARRITISTAGVTPGVDRFASERQPFRLAISLNHPDPEQRSSIMPHNERYPLGELLVSARRYTTELGRSVTFEYVMMPGINMGTRHLEQLVKIGRSMRCKINLIPLNTDLGGLRRPTTEEATDFQRRLSSAGVLAFNRGSPGRNVEGACGMLALRRLGSASPAGGGAESPALEVF